MWYYIIKLFSCSHHNVQFVKFLLSLQEIPKYSSHHFIFHLYRKVFHLRWLEVTPSTFQANFKEKSLKGAGGLNLRTDRQNTFKIDQKFFKKTTNRHFWMFQATVWTKKCEEKNFKIFSRKGPPYENLQFFCPRCSLGHSKMYVINFFEKSLHSSECALFVHPKI